MAALDTTQAALPNVQGPEAGEVRQAGAQRPTNSQVWLLGSANSGVATQAAAKLAMSGMSGMYQEPKTGHLI
jgi:hypothetical protein